MGSSRAPRYVHDARRYADDDRDENRDRHIGSTGHGITIALMIMVGVS
jgi:hypothetical protein